MSRLAIASFIIADVSSRQIRPPIYSIKQSKLRKRRVIRFATLYFVMLIIFVALLAGPLVVAKLKISLPTIPMALMQPTGLNYNDTSNSQTGKMLHGGTAAVSGAATASSSSTGGAKLRFF